MTVARKLGMSPDRDLRVRRAPWALAVVPLLLCAVTAGCSGGRLPMAAVQGKVTYHGKPLEFGSVIFQPQAGPTASGPIQADGSFRLSTYGRDDGAVLGKHQVLITCYDNQRPAGAPPDLSKEPGAGRSLIPPIYSTMNSPLEIEVKKGMEPVALELTDAAAEKPR